MKKRIFAIFVIILTLTLSVFTVFADEYVREDIIGEEVFSYNGDLTIGSSCSFHDLYLEPGLYLVDFDWCYAEGENHDGIFYLRNIHNQTYLSYKFRDYGSETFYVYITTPCDIYFQSSNGGTSFNFSVAVYSTKSYSDIYSYGYDRGHSIGYAQGQESGYDQGYTVGYNTGHAEGLTKANDYAYNSGYEIGHEEGRAEGYNNGYSVGKNAGYILGEADGWKNAIEDADEVKTAIGGIFTGIFDGAVDSFNELTEGITIMGLTLKQILLTIVALGIIGICIWLFALKK